MNEVSDKDVLLNRVIRERAILIGVVHHNQNRSVVQEYLDELALLADTAGADVVVKELQDKDRIDPATYIGKGKVDYLSQLVSDHHADLVIFDDDLSPAQVRNLENRCKVKILDRSGIILDIFAKRAKTKEAKTQVELAQLNYLLPRLTRRWTHLSRQTGGAGIGLRGPGETQLEVDRRLIKKRISKLNDELVKIGKQRQIRRQHRTDCFRVALIGYTNVGKSTLLNSLCDADVFVEDRLFATLDSTVRRLETDHKIDILLIDTVGFIRKLPHQLVASFKSTLEEIRDSDLLLHVVDICAPYVVEQINAVQVALAELNLSDKPVLYVFNKVDRLIDKSMIIQYQHDYSPCVFISASRGIFVNELKERIKEIAQGNYFELKIRLNINNQRELAQIYEVATVLEKKYSNEHIDLLIRIKKDKFPYIEPYVS
ncbi:GTPase HflX [candidate division KSB1 bacterium]|nr:GTPase HflX [candidate division KSB1 bacterium]